MDLISNLQTTLDVAYTHDTSTKIEVDSVTNFPADGVVRIEDATHWVLQRYDLVDVPNKELETLTDPKAIFESTGASGHVFAIGTTVTLVFTGDYLDELVPGTPLLANGTVPLTANWDAGAFEIRALTFESDVATGTAPFTIASTTVVPNLNADLIDGHHFADAILAAGTVPLTAAWDAGSWQIRAETFRSDVVTGTAPLTVASTTVVANLNAAFLNGATAAAWVLADGTNPLTANWDAGAFQIRALTFYSDVATGTAPFTIASTTVVANLNVDQVDGLDSTDLVLVDGTQPLTGNWDAGAFEITIATIDLTGGQIAFPAGAVPSADPNTVDDYEEGSFTPTVGGDSTYTTALGEYVKVGKEVTININMKINVIGTGSTTTLSGLPFANANTVNNGISIGYFADLNLNTIFLTGYIPKNTSIITFCEQPASDISVTPNATIFKNITDVIISGTYFI